MPNEAQVAETTHRNVSAPFISPPKTQSTRSIEIYTYTRQVRLLATGAANTAPLTQITQRCNPDKTDSYKQLRQQLTVDNYHLYLKHKWLYYPEKLYV